MRKLAHSARGSNPPQFYADHITGVKHGAVGNITKTLRHSTNTDPIWRKSMVSIVEWAAECHDLGKLYRGCQDVLVSNSKGHLPIRHEDAGASFLKRAKFYESMLLAFSHHGGLPDCLTQQSNGQLAFRSDDDNTRQVTDTWLDQFILEHDRELGIVKLSGIQKPLNLYELTGLERRLCLSCLVDADYSDTARATGGVITPSPPKTRWQERFDQLKQKIQEKNRLQGNTSRNLIRQEMFDECAYNNLITGTMSLRGPTGTGKTTAGMARLLRIAIARNSSHIFVVQPFTQLINQTVQNLRNYLCLSGEDPESIVAEHHHAADFSSITGRQLATLWDAPIIVTTAVQFFETLGGNWPARLRKLHELPGSAVFIDECHASIPLYLWQQMWLWLEELVKNWDCHFMFSSGSLVRFWEIQGVLQSVQQIPDILSSQLLQKAEAQEKTRVKFKYIGSLHPADLVDRVLAQTGSRLVILNTVQTAAVIASKVRNAVRQRGLSIKVFHLSTALAPCDRETIVSKVVACLKSEENPDMILVATSCVEAGMDFSFQTAFRENASAMSSLQPGGRVNRNGEFITTSVVFVFQLQLVDNIKFNPALQTSMKIQRQMFDSGWFNGNKTTTEIATFAVRRQVDEEPANFALMASKEKNSQYKEVADLCKVIDEKQSQTVVVYPTKVLDAKTLQKYSVQVLSNKMSDLGLPAFTFRGMRCEKEIFEWIYKYDPDFLGYMEGMLEQQAIQKGMPLVV